MKTIRVSHRTIKSSSYLRRICRNASNRDVTAEFSIGNVIVLVLSFRPKNFNFRQQDFNRRIEREISQAQFTGNKWTNPNEARVRPAGKHVLSHSIGRDATRLKTESQPESVLSRTCQGDATSKERVFSFRFPTHRDRSPKHIAESSTCFTRSTRPRIRSARRVSRDNRSTYRAYRGTLRSQTVIHWPDYHISR